MLFIPCFDMHNYKCFYVFLRDYSMYCQQQQWAPDKVVSNAKTSKQTLFRDEGVGNGSLRKLRLCNYCLTLFVTPDSHSFTRWPRRKPFGIFASMMGPSLKAFHTSLPNSVTVNEPWQFFTAFIITSSIFAEFSVSIEMSLRVEL